MGSGLHYDSIADLPVNLRGQVAAQLLKAQKTPAQLPEEPEAPNRRKAKSKYGNEKTEVGGHTFDSKKEARRFETLMRALELGLIYDLRLQRDYTLKEAYTKPDGTRIRAIRYKADFTYKVSNDVKKIIDGNRKVYLDFDLQDLDFLSHNAGLPYEIVEDVKSSATKTKVYIIKKKLMADLGHEIREV